MENRLACLMRFLLVFLVPIFSIGLSTKALSAEKYELRWATIVAGGAWQVIGNAMLEDVKSSNPDIVGSTVPSSTTANLMGLGKGKFNIGFSLTDTTADAWEGKGYFSRSGPIKNLRALAALYPQATHIVVWADSDIEKIEDLRGKRITPGAKGLSCDVEAQRLLEAYGMTYLDTEAQFLSFSDGASQFIDGHFDAIVWPTVPFPSAPVINVSSQRQIRLLSIPDDKINQLVKYRGVEAYTLPAGLYEGVDYPVKGIAVRAHLVVRDDMPDEIAYSITKAIVENLSRYPTVLKSMANVKMEDLPREVGIPLHPGAVKYYQERGLVR